MNHSKSTYVWIATPFELFNHNLKYKWVFTVPTYKLSVGLQFMNWIHLHTFLSRDSWILEGTKFKIPENIRKSDAVAEIRKQCLSLYHIIPRYTRFHKMWINLKITITCLKPCRQLYSSFESHWFTLSRTLGRWWWVGLLEEEGIKPNVKLLLAISSQTSVVIRSSRRQKLWYENCEI
jgi:hypothetical protein